MVEGPSAGFTGVGEGQAQSSSSGRPGVLFTAFEPSGDAHAAPVIRALAEKVPQVRIYAWGGPRMAAAGATLVETTAADGAMGLTAIGRFTSVRREVKRIERWSRQYRVLVHVAVDSPAANFPICRVMRRTGARVVHLVAPQMWAWGRWRLGKLRARTDLVLCFLPFEEQWFRDRDVPARFIGHPRMNRQIDAADLRKRLHGLPQGAPRIALFPGSRGHEVRANIRLLVSAYAELQDRHGGLAGVIVAASGDLATVVRRRIRVFPTGLHMVTADSDAAIAWADLCLAVSGTITLDITRQQKPMIGVYRTSVFTWLASKLILRTPYRLLPNIIAEREIVPEFVPYCGGALPIVRQANHLLNDSRNAAIQSRELARVCQRYVNKRPAREAVRAIIKIMTKGTID